MKKLLLAVTAIALLSGQAVATDHRCEAPTGYEANHQMTQATWDYAVCRWVRDQNDQERDAPEPAPASSPAPAEQEEEEHEYDD